MDNQDNLIQQYYDILVKNVQKMETYSIKMKNDPRTYTAVPMIPFKFQNNETKRFTLKIIHPKEYEGLYDRAIEDIDVLEKKKG
jgi:hypothetical protein